MPQDRTTKIETGDRQVPIRLHNEVRTQEMKRDTPHGARLPIWISFSILIAIAFSLAAGFVLYRRRAYRAWQKLAKEVGGEFSPLNEVSPRLVTGKLGSRPYLLETATSHEDDAGYYHTRSAVPLKNHGSFVMGVRRKSLLEEVQTRGEKSAIDLGQPDFEHRFYLYCNDPDNMAKVLTHDVRKQMLRYHDIEIYARLGEIEWRRSGEQSDLATIRMLNSLLLQMADIIDAFPIRSRSLTQCLADEKLIENGV